MLRNVESLLGNRIIAEDGFAGEVRNVNINTTDWRIAEVEIKIGGWFRSRSVRIPGVALRRPVGLTGMLPVALSRQEIKESPLEANQSEFFGEPKKEPISVISLGRTSGAPQLANWESIVGYRAYALDGLVGTLRDLIVDDDEWAIRYLVVEMALNSAEYQTLVPSDWVSGLYTEHSSISLSLSTSEIEGSPEYDPRTPINQDIEGRLYDYYGQPFRHK
jgi:sporulation protein YlmC with PRC-barrel domain